MKKIHFWFLSLFFWLLTQTSIAFALPFSITPAAGTSLPTAINQGSTATAYYTITNRTSSQRNNNFVRYLPPNVTQVTAGGTFSNTCGATFNLAARGQAASSCTLQLTISGAVDSTLPNVSNHLLVCFPGGITCAGTIFPLSVTVSGKSGPAVLSSIVLAPATASVARQTTSQLTATALYSDGTTKPVTSGLTWTSSNISVATVSAAGLVSGIAGGHTNITASMAGITSSAAVITVPAIAFITNSGTGTTNACPQNADGTLGTCTPYNGAAFNLAINGSKTFLYSSGNVSTTVQFAPISSSGSLGSFTPAGTVTLGFPAGGVVNPQNTFIYFTGNTNSANITVCTLLSDGTFTTCASTGSGFNNPAAIAINPAGTTAYVFNTTNNQMTICTISSVNGTLSNCTASVTITTVQSPGQMIIDPAGGNIYLGGAFAEVANCPINSDSSLGTCNTQVVNGLRGGMSFDNNGTFYYTSNNLNNAYACPINNDGSLGTCTIAATGLSSPRDILFG